MKRSLPLLALFAAILWAGAMVADPRDAQAKHVAKERAGDTTALWNACNGHVADMDYDKVLPGKPLTIRILCADQSQHSLVVR